MTTPALAAQTVYTGYDDVNLSLVPSNAQVVAGYVGGMWPTYDKMVRQFPHAAHVSIAVNASELTHNGKPVNCLDIEPGDAVPAQARAWDLAEIRLGEKHPCDYTMGSWMPALKAAVRGIPAVLWLAAYDGNPGLEGFAAHQWTDRALGRSLDADTFSSTFLLDLGLIAHVKVPVPVIGGAEHYELYPAQVWVLRGVKVSERKTVETWDRNRCENPVKRPVCRSTRAHLSLLLQREQRAWAKGPKHRPAHLPGRIQGLIHRLTGKGIVLRWE